MKSCVVLFFCFLTVFNFPQNTTPDPSVWVANNEVYTTAADAEYTYIGGRFNYLGPYTGRGIKLSTLDVTPNPNFPAINGYVRVAVPDGNGGWYIGGDFTTVGSYNRNRLAHINSDGTVDALWDPNASGSVYCIVVESDAIYVGGSFTSINGTTTRNYAAKLNKTDGTADPLWNPNCGDDVLAMAAGGGNIFLAGQFTTINGSVTRNRVAKVNNTNGNVNSSWNPNVSSSVYAIIVDGNDIYIAGIFTSVNGSTTRNRLAKLNNTNGTANASWDPNIGNSSVLCMTKSGNNLYIGGDFSTVNGNITRKSAAKLNLSTGIADASWNPETNSAVYSIAVDVSGVYLGGNFSAINGTVKRNNLARVNNTTGDADPSWIQSTGGLVYTIAINGNDIYTGGQFHTAGGYVLHGLARIKNSDGTADPTWNPDINGMVNSIKLVEGGIYAGGTFTSVNGSVARSRLAKFNLTDGTVDPLWNPNANNIVNVIALDGSNIYAGGSFTNVNSGTVRNGAAKFNSTDGTADPLWNPNAPGAVFTIVPNGNQIYIGGSFNSINGNSTIKRLARVNDTDGSLDQTWIPSVNGSVTAILINNNDVFLGGDFSKVNDTITRNKLAKVRASDAIVDELWNPNAGSRVNQLLLRGTRMYAAGAFLTIGGNTSARTLVRLNLTDGKYDSLWLPNPNTIVEEMIFRGNDLFAVGTFFLVGNETRPYMALFRDKTSPPPLVFTDSVSNLGMNSATLHGTVNPNTVASKAYFEYGTTTAYGMRTDTADVGSGTSPVPVTKVLTGLTPGTLYHYRLVGFNDFGSSNGSDSVFTTLVQPVPTVTTLASDSIGIYSMRFRGTVNPQGDSTRYYFQYNVGSTVSYTDTAYAGNGTSVVNVSKYLTGLHPGRAYSVKLFAFNSAGTASGSFMAASTLPAPAPIAFTGSTNPITQTSGRMFGTINAQGDSTYWYFEYGTTTSYGTRTDTMYLGRGLTNVGVNKLITGLQPNTRYYYRIAAYNSSGLTNAGGTSFVTLDRVLSLTSPVGGEGYEPGSTTNITWNAGAVDTLKIEYSSDNGNTWSLVIDNRVTTGGSYSWTVPSVATTQGRIRLTSKGVTPEIVSNAAGVFTIAGANLANMPTGTEGNMNGNSYPDNNNGTAVGDSGTVINTTDGGNTWSSPAGPAENITTKSFRDVSTPSRYTRIAVGDSGTVYNSTNAGLNWSAVSTPTTQNYYAVSFTDTLTGTIAGSNGTIIRTTNGGTSWVQQASGTTKTLYDIYFTNSNIGTAVGEDGTILYTTNGGSSWSAQSSGTTQHLHGVWFVKNAGLHQIGYAVGDSGVSLKTTNGGGVWNALITVTSKNLNAVAFTTAERGAAAGDGGVVIYTSDGGTVWKSLVGAGSTDVNNIAVPSTGGVMYMAGSSGKIFKDTAGVVPVELTSFTASSANGKVTLTWVTASELNNAGFDVERAESANREFAKIGEVTGKGTTTQTSEYIFTDEKAVTGKYLYRLKQKDYDGTFSYSPEVEAEVTIPIEYALSQNYPNPFNPSTHIKYQLPEPGNVLLEVYDIQGSLVRRLVNGKQEAGYYSITFEAGNLPSGVYIYRLTSGKFTQTKKLMLMK